MNITPAYFEAFLKCPTKCWLRFTGEPPAGNSYAEWVQTETESYRAAAAKQLMATVPADEFTAYRSSRREEAHYLAETLKTAKWRFAVDIPARTEFGSSRSNEAQTSSSQLSTLNPQPTDQSLLTSAATIETCLHAVERIPSAGRGQPAQFVPIRFIHRNKLTQDDKLLLAFDAFVLSEMLGRTVSLGKIIHGDDNTTLKVKLGARTAESARTLVTSKGLMGEVRKRIEQIAALLSGGTNAPNPESRSCGPLGQQVGAADSETRGLGGPRSGITPPDLVLNRHCAECEFQARCRKLAVEKDDLSLLAPWSRRFTKPGTRAGYSTGLAGMSAKERQKLRSKGIFTVTQLSYTFRSRRRPRRQRSKREKYHHALKALAIREQKIHIVGSPELKIEGTPVYLDVEGLPDRDFYYLIGVCIGHGDSAVQHSLWADTVADEGKIWREFLGILETVEQPVLIHYGSYETTFLKVMMERRGKPQDESVAAKAIGSAINLVSVMFAKIYFQTYSNSLKEIARHLNFEWSDANATGTGSIAWRQDWEESHTDVLMHRLITYNAEDCKALDTAVIKLIELQPSSTGDKKSVPDGIIDTTKLKWEHPYGFKRNNFVFPELDGINSAAYWDYQRDRVFVKSNVGHGRKSRPTSRPRKTPAPNKTNKCSRPHECPKCGSSKFHNHIKYTKTLYDLKFMRHGIKRWITCYQFHRYECQNCRTVFQPVETDWGKNKFGPEIIAYAIYLIIELRLPQIHVASMLNRLFGFHLDCSNIGRFKTEAAVHYKVTYNALVKRLCSGRLLHADETRARVRDDDGFVWVFANMEEVAYFYTETREGELVQTMLKDFKGVLVSDFYAAYDSIQCPQQKCLIHLIRDLNDDVLKHPYDEELKRLALAFTLLLKPIIESIDRHGLKSHFLKKHLVFVERFYRHISKTSLQSETAVKFKERIEKNRDKLFTFLNFDGIPWNNNNAEHAVKPFAKLRQIFGGITTEKSIRDYLILLSVCQTCQYMGVDFLDFLRSGEQDIHAFAESRHRRKRPAPTRPPARLPPDAIPPSGGQP